MFKDPVCNMMVDEKKAKFTSKIGDKTVYLCSGMCESEFDANPSKFGYWLELSGMNVEKLLYRKMQACVVN